MSPKAMGVHFDWGFSGDALCDEERSMEWDQVWSWPTSARVIGECDAVS